MGGLKEWCLGAEDTYNRRTTSGGIAPSPQLFRRQYTPLPSAADITYLLCMVALGVSG